jgi:hypothetical protein
VLLRSNGRRAEPQLDRRDAVKKQVEYDTTLWARRDAQREKRFEAKIKRQAQQLGYKLEPIEERAAPLVHPRCEACVGEIAGSAVLFGALKSDTTSCSLLLVQFAAMECEKSGPVAGLRCTI